MISVIRGLGWRRQLHVFLTASTIARPTRACTLSVEERYRSVEERYRRGREVSTNSDHALRPLALTSGEARDQKTTIYERTRGPTFTTVPPPLLYMSRRACWLLRPATGLLPHRSIMAFHRGRGP